MVCESDRDCIAGGRAGGRSCLLCKLTIVLYELAGANDLG